MSQLIQPILDAFFDLLCAKGATGSEPPFGDVFIGPPTGVIVNPPTAWVIPVRTQFPDQGEGNMRNETHLVTVRLGITGLNPAELTTRTVAYVKAVDLAINCYKGWPGMASNAGDGSMLALRAWVMEHDYGPMYKLNNVGAYWPDLHCQVEVEELS